MMLTRPVCCDEPTPFEQRSKGEIEPRRHGQRLAGRVHVFRETEPAKRIYQVVDGAVMLYKLLPDGRRQIVELVGPGGVFGLSSLPVYDCFAETLSASEVISYDSAQIEQSPELFRRLTAQVREQFCAMHAHAVVLGRKTATERVASFMMRRIPGRGGYNCPGPRGNDDSARIPLGMTRQEIADYLCLTIETVSRILTLFRRHGLVTMDKREQLRVNNVCRMCQLTGDH